MADHARSDNFGVQAQLDRFAQLSPGRDILGLERISALLARLGDPQLRLPPVFHVAGTNGKGSTCAFLRAALEAAGYSVHVYTSPHLVRFNERFRLAGALITDAALAALLAEVLDAAGDIGPSFFEATTAAAFLAFSRVPADACIIEVGLGGRLDATNVIRAPLVCGIAQLGIDHESFLGSDPVRIAGEKAGIAKRGVPLVTGDYAGDLADRISKISDDAGASVLCQGQAWAIDTADNSLAYRDSIGPLVLPAPRLFGQYQVNNAGLAVAMLRHQKMLNISAEAICAAMRLAEWPARLQQLSVGPIVREGDEIWLDGCHNPVAAELVAASFIARAPITLICGILANKDASGILRQFAGIVAKLIAVPVPDHAHYLPKELVEIARSLEMKACTADNVSAALADAPGGCTLIMGSLYLAGEVLRLNNQVPV